MPETPLRQAELQACSERSAAPRSFMQKNRPVERGSPSVDIVCPIVTGAPALHPNAPGPRSAIEALDRCQVMKLPLFIVGTFDAGVTILSQQVRALNLAWALIETGQVPTELEQSSQRVAVVGGGFAGLTVAAALLTKGARVQLTVFERRDTLLPLQQGSDSRWVHPHIYDWPAMGSESPSAALPLLNWTASRASDVAVQVLREWADIADSASDPESLRVYCNTRYLQVQETTDTSRNLRIEWVGERRRASSPAIAYSEGSATHGVSEIFDLVVLSLGFGLEVDQRISYWRNDTLAQPHLGEATVMYIVSGQGDGAVIDLLRLRVSQFRQDRILSELFANRRSLLAQLRSIEAATRESNTGLFNTLEALWSDPVFADEATAVLSDLADRLRRDTRAVLHVKQSNFADLFSQGRVSFQNRLLLYLLYRCGGFYPSSTEIDELARELDVPEQRIIRRHGTRRQEIIRGVLSSRLYTSVETASTDEMGRRLRQPDSILWPGGYFGYSGPTSTSGAASDLVKASWRKEYLPGPTKVLATAFCSAVAGYLSAMHPPDERLRVTLHRTLRIGHEELLQQCCEYAGVKVGTDSSGGSAGRTFPANHATIGDAFLRHKIVRSREGVRRDDLAADMLRLKLNESSRAMSSEVGFVMAVPFLSEMLGQGEDSVVAVLYVDSEAEGFFIDGDRLATLVNMGEQFLRNALRLGSPETAGIANYSYWANEASTEPPPVSSVRELATVEELVVPPPRVAGAPYFNYDVSDFIRVED